MKRSYSHLHVAHRHSRQREESKSESAGFKKGLKPLKRDLVIRVQPGAFRKERPFESQARAINIFLAFRFFS